MNNSEYLRINLYDNERLPFGLTECEYMPTASVFLADSEKSSGHAMLAFAGGAYSFHSPLTGIDYGAYFRKHGISVIFVDYRLGSDGYDCRAFCADALAAVEKVIIHAEDWGIDPNKLGVIGSSAGGHLAGVLSTGQAELLLSKHSDELGDLPLDWRPEFAIFCYSVLSLESPLRHIATAAHFLGDKLHNRRWQRRYSPISHITSEHCRSFIWHSAEDLEVPIDNSIAMYLALHQNGVPVEFHAYARGPHILGLAQDVKHEAKLHWAMDAVRWIRDTPIELIKTPQGS